MINIASSTKLIFSALFLFSFGLSHAQGIEFEHGNWKDILKVAQEKDRYIMVDAFTDWCGPCKWMSANTFTDSAVGIFMTANYVSYKMDMEKGEGPDFAKKNKVNAYPTILFFDKNGKLLSKSVGAKNAEMFLQLCEKMLDPNNHYSTYVQRYNDGERSVDFLKGYMDAAMGANEDARPIFDEYSDLLSDDEKIDADYYSFMYKITNGFGDYKDPLFEQFLKNKEAYTELNDEGVVKAHLERSLFSNLRKYSNLESEEEQTAFINDMKILYPDQAGEMKELYYYWYYYRSDDPEKKQKAVDDYMAITKNSNALNSEAWDIYENSDDTEELEKGLTWVNRSIELNENYNNLDTKGAILYKLGKYEEALKIMDKAISVGEKDDLNVDASIKLKEEIESKL